MDSRAFPTHWLPRLLGLALALLVCSGLGCQTVNPVAASKDRDEAKSLREEILFHCPPGSSRSCVEELLKENGYKISTRSGEPFEELIGLYFYAEKARRVGRLSGRHWEVAVTFDGKGGLVQVLTRSNLVDVGLIRK